MPPLSVRAKQAKQRRGNGNQRFIDLKNDFSSLPSEENLINLSEFIETLIGEDDWCGQDIEEKNVVDLTDDKILSEIDNNEDNSIENILQRWRESASRQEESFLRRGDSERCLRYMDGYRIGLIGPELDYAIRKYKGHRMIPPENLQLIKDEFKKQQDEKMKLSFKSN